MKAAYMERHGGPEVLKYGDLPDPAPKPGEIVVDIHAASINGADWRVRTGDYAKLSTFPYVLGRDFSGIVSAVGQGVSDFRVGDPVFAVCEVGQEGTYCREDRHQGVHRRQEARRHQPCRCRRARSRRAHRAGAPSRTP